MLIRKKFKLAIICSHPIQYYVPVFKLLAQKAELKVFYTKSKNTHYDKGFQQTIHWDLPLLEGYNYEFIPDDLRYQGLINSIVKFNPSHLLIYGWAYYSHIKILSYFKGKIPISFRGDSTLLNTYYSLKNVVKRPLLKWIYSHVDQAFYTGQHNKAYYKKYGLKESQLIFAPHAVDNHRFSLTNPVISSTNQVNFTDIRRQLKLNRTDVLILYAGKFIAVKNLQLLLKAFIELNLSHAHLLFVGNGILEKSLKRQSSAVRKQSLNQRIHFMPFQNQSAMPAVYQACDLFCLPSKKESWGLCINEAMAAGKAILASDKVGSADDLISAQNGKIFKSNNLTDLKQTLKEMIVSREQLSIKGMSSRRIIADWSFKIQVKNILNGIQN